MDTEAKKSLFEVNAVGSNHNKSIAEGFLPDDFAISWVDVVELMTAKFSQHLLAALEIQIQVSSVHLFG